MSVRIWECMQVSRSGGAPPASCACALAPDLLFLGSWAGDSLLVRAMRRATPALVRPPCTDVSDMIPATPKSMDGGIASLITAWLVSLFALGCV